MTFIIKPLMLLSGAACGNAYGSRDHRCDGGLASKLKHCLSSPCFSNIDCKGADSVVLSVAVSKVAQSSYANESLAAYS